MNKISIIMVLCVAVSACSTRYSSNGEYIYLKSRNGEKVTAPAPLTNNNLSSFYDLPPQNANPVISITPPGG